jgi:hypothetical protein
MIILLLLVLVISLMSFGIIWAGRVLHRATARRWPFAVGAGLFAGAALALLVTPSNPTRNAQVNIALFVVCLISSSICFAALFEPGSKPSAADAWSKAHGLTVTERNADFIVAYVFEGHRLRLVCGIGGLVAAMALSAGSGIDLKATGWVWLLSGYLVGVIWSEAWLTRLPTGTQRSASLSPRRLGDYLARGLLVMQALTAGTAISLAGFARSRGSDLQLEGGFPDSFSGASPQSLQHACVLFGIVAAVLMSIVTVLQQHIVRKAQPMADPDLLLADDAVRASAVHLLSGTAIAIVLLLIANQLRLLAAIGGVTDALAAISGALCFLGALVFWRHFGHRAWVVRRGRATHGQVVALEGAGS